jgi:regulator of sigma E protease
LDILQLIPSFGNLLFTLAAFVSALLVIVAIHEYGHYIVGRWTGIDAEIFSLGFGPVIWSRTDKRGTQWQIAAVPLGGYVRFLGDGDAASALPDDNLKNVSPDEARRSMHGAPLWARSATVAAGPIFNFALSIILFAGLIMFRGIATEPLTIADMPDLPYVNQLQAGDEILAIEGQTTPELSGFSAFANELPVKAPLSYEILRGDQTMTVDGPHPYPAMVSAVSPDSAAADGNIKVGDVILAVNDVDIHGFSELQAAVAAADGSPVDLLIWRKGDEFSTTLAARRTDLPLPDGGFETRWLVGISGGLWFEPESKSPGFFKAIGMGFDQTVFVVEASISGLYHMIVGEISTCNLRGPIGIAETSGTVAAQGVLAFISFIALLSTAVGMLNLFPIPVLDGGHLVFHAYEAIAGKPPSDGALRVIMSAGLAIILTMMVFALSNDLFCP